MWGQEKGVRTPEFNKKLERRRKIKLGLIIIGLIVLISIPIYILRTEKFLIQSVEIEGNELTKNEDIQKIISDNLDGNYLLIFPKSNLLLYPKEKIAKDLSTKLPRLKDVEVSLINRQTLKVSLSEREPLALYCQNIENPSVPSDCYFLDDEGYIFSKAPSFSGEVYTVYSSDPVYEDPLRSLYMDSDKFRDVHTFMQGLPSINLYPRVFIKKQDEFNLLFSNYAVMMFKSDADLEKVFSNIKSFFEDGEAKKDLNRMLYVDMRFGNKIFYKLREDEMQNIEIPDANEELLE